MLMRPRGQNVPGRVACRELWRLHGLELEMSPHVVSDAHETALRTRPHHTTRQIIVILHKRSVVAVSWSSEVTPFVAAASRVIDVVVHSLIHIHLEESGRTSCLRVP